LSDDLARIRRFDGERMPTQVQLTDEDVAFLLMFLRSATAPVTTQQLIDALRGRGR
jgi:hypothetical protein